MYIISFSNLYIVTLSGACLPAGRSKGEYNYQFQTLFLVVSYPNSAESGFGVNTTK
ncbi:MAG: hypothetical protein MUF28_04995 [Ignavibacterium sp.]|nr:hypothetical protein [Ignavibacterium sp.]